MAKDLSNFLPLSRKIFDHEFWDEKRPFSKFEAWIDLLQTARYEKDTKSDWINNKQITYTRGQLPSSVRFLMKRWNWGSLTKVESFLKHLKNKDMVALEKGQGQFVITICKYESYNPVDFEEKTAKRRTQGQQKDESNKEIKNKYLDIVELTEKEYDKLCSDYGKELADSAIQYLNNWGKEKSKKFKEYEDHNLTIRRWVIKAVTQNQQTLFTKKDKTVTSFEEVDASQM